MLEFTGIVAKGRKPIDEQVYYQAMFDESNGESTSSFPITLTADKWKNFEKALQHSSEFRAKTRFSEVIIDRSQDITILYVIKSFIRSDNSGKKDSFAAYHGPLNNPTRTSLRSAAATVLKMV